MLRVGGRIGRVKASMDTKHQIIIPSKSRLAELIINHAHHVILHGGTQVMASYIRQRFWIPKLRQTICTHILKCVMCVRIRARAQEQMIGNLPLDRVTKAHPFEVSGVDFAGPFQMRKFEGKVLPVRAITSNIVRQPTMLKVWVVVFVCFVTPAVHLDIVHSLSTEHFLAAFSRFTSRRG